jgi:hypothetical protein
MKIKTLISACFAGTGIYLALTGSITVVLSFYLITAGGDDPFNKRMMLLQYFAFCMPFIIGVLFLAFAPKLAAVVCRFAKLGEEELTAVIHPEVAIIVACVVTGLTLAISQIPELARLTGKQFLASANPVYAADHRGEDYRMMMIRPGLYSALAIIVLWKARVLASWLVSKYQKP